MNEPMESAGFENIRGEGEELDFIYSSEDAWWSTSWSHGMGVTLERIMESGGETALHEFKGEAFETIRNVEQADGFHHPWPVYFTQGKKPETQ